MNNFYVMLVTLEGNAVEGLIQTDETAMELENRMIKAYDIHKENPDECLLVFKMVREGA